MDYYNDFEDSYASTSLGKLHFLHHSGSKAKLIFLHGFGATTKTWERLMGSLPEDLDIYLIDMLGFGKSDAPDIDYSIENQYRSLVEVVKQLDLDDCFLVGNSYGGWLAAYYAAYSSVKGLILEDPAGLKQHFDDILETVGRDNYKEEMFRRAMLFENREHVIKSSLDSDYKSGQLTHELLAKINVPVLIIWGENDQTISAKYAGMFKEEIANSELCIVKGGSHYMHFTDPQRFAEALLGFIRKHTNE